MSGQTDTLDVELGRPPMWLAAMEMPRMMFEMLRSQGAMLLSRFAPQGDGHPVLVLPPFFCDDTMTACLRKYLARGNYRVYGWGLGKNQGPKTTGQDGGLLVRRVTEICEQNDQKLSLIGWSLGGIQAREIAKGMSDSVRQVITLSSPFGGGLNATYGSELFARMSGEDTSGETFRETLRVVRTAPEGIPCTAIFSKTDGIANWRACIERPGPLTDNIEVVSSHCGMGFNAEVLYALADRLAVDVENWIPFDRNTDRWRRQVYPSSGHQYGH